MSNKTSSQQYPLLNNQSNKLQGESSIDPTSDSNYLDTTDNVSQSSRERAPIKGQPHPHVKLYKYRYVIMGIFCSALFSNMVSQTSMQTIADLVMDAYDITTITWTFVSLVIMFAYIVGNFPSNYLIQSKGSKPSVILGILCNITGAWLKVLINEWFYITIIGNLFIGCGQFFLINSLTAICNDWLGVHERMLWNSIINIFIFGGLGLGFMVPEFNIQSDTEDYPKAQSQIQSSLLVQAIIISLTAIGIFFLKSKPPTPPSLTADVQRGTFTEQLIDLLKNKNFHFVNGYFLCVNTIYNLFQIDIDIIIEKYDFSQHDSVLFSVLFVLSGCVGCFVAGIFIQKTGQFKNIAIFSGFCHFLFLGAFMITLEFYQGKFVIGLLISLIGFFNIMVQPIALELAAEVTYPVSETFSAGFLLSSAQLLTLPVSIFVGYLFDNSSIFLAQTPGLIISFIGFLATLFIKEDLRKMNQDENASEEEEGDTEGISNTSQSYNDDNDDN